MEREWVEWVLRRELREAGRVSGESAAGEVEFERARAVTDGLMDVLLGDGLSVPFMMLRCQVAKVLGPLLARSSGVGALRRLLYDDFAPEGVNESYYLHDWCRELLGRVPVVEADVRAFLLSELNASDARAQWRAVVVLGATATEDADVAAVLLARLRAGDSSAARSLRGAAARQDAVLQGLLDLLPSDIAELRDAAVEALADAAREQDAVALRVLPLVGDGAEPVRLSAVEVLEGAVGHASVVRALLKLLLPWDDVAALIALTGDADNDWRRGVVRALEHAAPSDPAVAKEMVAVLSPLLHDATKSTRSQAVSALSGLAQVNVDVARLLLPLLHDAEDSVRLATAYTLQPIARLQETVAWDLVDLFWTANDGAHLAAAVALNWAVGVFPAVAQALLPTGWDDATTQAALARPLLARRAQLRRDLESGPSALFAQIVGHDEAVALAVAPLLHDPDPDVREGTALALSETLHHPASVAHALLPLLTPTDPPLRRFHYIAWAVADALPTHPQLKSVLLPALHNHDPLLEDIAWNWLDQNAALLL